MSGRELSQEVKDALADAETLELFAVWQGPLGTRDVAGQYVEDAGLNGDESRGGVEWCDDFWAGEYAREAARAAFKAVPGLREE